MIGKIQCYNCKEWFEVHKTPLQEFYIPKDKRNFYYTHEDLHELSTFHKECKVLQKEIKND